MISQKTYGGMLDTDFGDKGIVTIVNGNPDYGTVHIQKLMVTDSWIYFGGRSARGDSVYITMGRLDLKGNPDPKYGENGLVQYLLPGFGALSSFALQTDGRIIVHADHASSTSNFSYFYRLEEDGSLDKTFGEDGLFSLELLEDHDSPSMEQSQLLENSAAGQTDMVILSDGKILTFHRNGWIIRLTPEGKPDKTFSAKGYIYIKNPHNPTSLLRSLLVDDKQEKYVVGGLTLAASSHHAMLACFHKNGEPDESFGRMKNGFVVFDVRASEFNQLVRQNNGRILGVGTAGAFPDIQALLISSEPNGEPNIQFNQGQPLLTSLDKETQWEASAFQENGRSVVVGSAGTFKPMTHQLVVARFNSNGTPDTSFGNGQGYVKQTLPSFGKGRYMARVALQPDDEKILVSAIPLVPKDEEPGNPVILRYLPN
ncbi:hypothetical protein J1G18_12470 [Pseudomonas sp. MIS38]|uniref:hypothetical protein n=1 Tax=unclassified Pseudomonas TaxID=196821 RepID=UPI001CA6FE68|nr:MULTISPECIES: hypothetical protein [unclassified Pseudomonas]MBY8958108.1 hypothetical protein [Pseudomonas sp. MIS38]